MSRGVRNDYFSLDTGGVHIQSSSTAPEALTTAVRDSRGDVACEETYGELIPVECGYQVCSGSSFDSGLKLCEVVGDYVVTRINATRNNQNALSVTVGGVPKSSVGDTSTLPTYTIPWPDSFCAGGKGAKEAGYTVTAGRVLSSSCNVSVEMTQLRDSVGEVVCTDFYGAKIEASNEVQSCDTAPAATLDTGWTESVGSGAKSESNTDYESATFTAHKNLSADT